MRGILLDNADIKVGGGEIAIGDNTMDVIENIIDSNNGEWKNNRFLGVGIKTMTAQSGSGLEIRHKIIENLQREHISVNGIMVENDEINIEI